jgi:hypothetical protein
MAVTERLEPQLLQVTKYSLFSPLLSSVSGLRQVLQVTYSTVGIVSTKESWRKVSQLRTYRYIYAERSRSVSAGNDP